MPYDLWSLVTICASTVLLLVSWRSRRSTAVRLSLILAAAVLIRCDAAFQRSLHQWDESYHALVAKNLAADPLKPTLYRAPAVPYDYRDWTGNHVWLHKPPGALWMMAASMRVFGTNELAMRTPSLVMSVLAVLLTFSIGRTLFSERVGLLAAGFSAVNGFVVGLTAGRRVADHVDTALIFFVSLSIWAVVRFTTHPRRAWLWLAGAALGAALLVKSFPALLVLPVAFVMLGEGVPITRRLRLCLEILASAALVALPWTLFAWARYPSEAQWSSRYTILHMTQVVQGQVSHWWTYLADLPRFFGELALLSFVLAIATALRRGPWTLPGRSLLVWIGTPYILFSLFATRLPGYVMTAAPALFILEAWVWTELQDRAARLSGIRRVASAAVLAVLVLTPARYLLERRGVFEKRDRSPEFAEQLRRLEARLGVSDAVIFNLPRPIDAMFYSPYSAYGRMPTEEEVRALSARGRPVVIYQPRGQSVELGPGWRVMLLREEELESHR